MADPIRIVMGSDYHFGLLDIPQLEMARAFADTIFPLIPETDILFINGDFFDALVIFDNHGFDPIYELMIQLLSLCDKHQCKLRILQGTWSHDRQQLRHFITFHNNGNYAVDLRLCESIEVEEITIRDRTLRFLYVPDNLPYPSSDDLVMVIEEKLLELGWDYVDYACMHGFFDFTFPANVRQDNQIVFRQTQFGFVKKLIDVGHVHQHRINASPNPGVYPDAISNGSFDRIVHGDEDPKGCIRIWDHPDHYTAQFVENKDAAIFATLTIEADATTEEIRDQVTEFLAKQTTTRTIFLRFFVKTLVQAQTIRTWMRETHPKIRCQYKRKTEKDEESHLVIHSDLMIQTQKRLAPTPKTLASFVRSHIPAEYPLTHDEIERYLESSAEK